MNNQNKNLNFKISPKDQRDYVVKPLKLDNNVKIVDLSPNCTPVKDQGMIGSCTAFASVALMEYVYKKNGIVIPDDLLSELFLYYNTRVLIENVPATNDSGAYLRDTLKSMIKYGVCLEKSFPYSSKYALKPLNTAYTEGLKYQVVKYANIPTINPQTALSDLKALLQSGYSFIGGIYCYENFFQGVNGYIPPPSGKIIGGHAVCFVGYDDTKQVFKFKNSWGRKWGDNGYGYLPYRYLLTNNMVDLWTVYGEEYNDKYIGSVGSIIPPNLRKDSINDKIKMIMSTMTKEINKETIDKLKEDINKDENNFLLFSKDVQHMNILIQNLETSLKDL